MTSTLQRLLNNPKDFPDARLQVGDFYLRTSKWDAAIGTLEEGARLNPTDAVRYQIRIANALLAQGKKTDAGQLVALILKDHPNEPEARAARAMMRLESGKPEDIDLAEAEFQALVKEKPKDATLRFHLALALQAKGDLAAAKKELQEAIRQRSDYLPPRLALGTISLRQGKPGDALNYAGEILALDPANARAKLLRALGLTAMARYDDARSQLVQLIKEFPQYRGAQIQLGVVAIAQKKFKDAEAIFGRLRESGENDVWSAAGSVETYVAENQFEKALQLLNEAVKKSPDSVALRMLLASTADRAGRYDLAIFQYQHLLSRDPKSAKVCLRLGDEYRRKGDTDGAIAMFRQAQRLAPKDPGAAMLLANTLAMTGRAEQARPEFKHLLELRPDDPFVLNDASFNLAETGGDLDEALRMIQRALRKMPSRPDFADTLGWIYLKKNMTEPALQIFSSLVNRNPANPTFRYHLGAALLQKGDSRGARAALQAALGYKPSRDETGKIHQLLGRAGVG
jgi:Flp pilus assembly protein TadD